MASLPLNLRLAKACRAKTNLFIPPKTQHDRRVIRVYCSHNISEKGTEFVGVCSSIEKKKKKKKKKQRNKTTTTKSYNGSKSAPVEFATVNMDLE